MTVRPSTTRTRIPVLVADDSIVFRRYLRDVLADCERISIVGEAKNGIEALDLILQVRPRVILLDMEMPLMDGMTALQHLMIHCPTPTIMFSSLTSEGTVRAFDALKNGAVDFFSKDLLFDEPRQEAFRKKIITRIVGAARMKVHSLEPAFDMARIAVPKTVNGGETSAGLVLFCEECGARNIVDADLDGPACCLKCGDTLIAYHEIERYHRNAHLTVFAGETDCCRNLLDIIPRLETDKIGSVLIVFAGEPGHVDRLTEYLDAISPLKILRGRAGMNLESGVGYIVCGADHLCLEPSRTQQALAKIKKSASRQGVIDQIMASAATIFRKKCLGVLLSCSSVDGLRGLKEVVDHGGGALVLHPTECLSARLVQTAADKISGVKIAENQLELARKVMELSCSARSGGAVI
ncbi:MAG: chemotaxis protein CheB [Desulfopila sp.]